MDTYSPLLEKTRVPQPSLQKYAVTTVFSKLRSAPAHLGPESDPGRHAISVCLHSASPPVADQAARELCRLVVDNKINLSLGLLELQSAIEGSNPNLSSLFVKSLGFLTRLSFQRNPHSFRSPSPENHPFVKILSCGAEVHEELVREVVLFMGKSKELGVERVCDFLRPFLNFSILRVPFSNFSSSYPFAKRLVSSLASFCCSFPDEALPVLRLLTDCFKFLPHKNSHELTNSYHFLECVVDAFTVVLRHLVRAGLLTNAAQHFGVELAETALSLLTPLHGHYGSIEWLVGLVKRLFEVQKGFDLPYPSELPSVVLSLLIVLLQLELEHEQLALLKLLIFLLKWKNDDEYAASGSSCVLGEELLLTFPLIHLMSSASKSVKVVAGDLLVMLEKHLVKLLITPKVEVTTQLRSPLISSPGSIVYRLLLYLWSQDQFSKPTSSFINFCTAGKTVVEGMHNEPDHWASQLREYSLWILEKQKSSSTTSKFRESFVSEISLLVSSIAGLLVMHQSLGNDAIDLLAAIGTMDPKQGVTLLLVVLFFCNIFTGKEVNHQNMLTKLLAMLPSLASHSLMIPLIIQTITPMLQKDGKLLLYTTGIRLLSKTWVINDRAFGSLQAVLLPKNFAEFKPEKNTCLSMAASVRDVCRKNPDRGVDLILSVSACIESQDPDIQALGLQGLSHLCEADVIDFYTAWDVISKHLLDYSTHPVLALSICLLLRWGALDAEAYAEASASVLRHVWDVGTSSRCSGHPVQWAKARASAFEALTQYEVPRLEKGIHDFKRETTELLSREMNFDVLRAMEELQVKIIMHEHLTRRRLVKEKRVARSKIEKLLDVLPQVLFPSGKSNAGKLPGAALFCLSFTPKDGSHQRRARIWSDIHTEYEAATVEIAASLQLSRNIFLALLSLQSWKSFMQHWMRANISTLDAKASFTTLDKTTKAATDILKSLMQVSEESIPRSAENIMLAIGALCLVLPPSIHTVKSSASKYLLNWLLQYGHEHRQWSAAISLGLISSCLHVTDHKQKLDNVTGLLEVLCSSRSTFVKGACGIGLGFSCQDLLTRTEASESIASDKETYKMQEIDLLGKIISTLLLMTSQLGQGSSGVLECLSTYFPHLNDIVGTHDTISLLPDQCHELDEDIWGIAGLALGLGNSIGAIYRAGALDAVLKLKELIISWIPHVDSLVVSSSQSCEMPDRILSVGSCLAVPIVVAFCRRVEMMNDNELDYLVNGFSKLISELVSVKRSGAFHQNLLMASCIGAGDLLSFILNEGVHPVDVNCVKVLLELFRACYSTSYHPVIHLGGMVGVVNAMGAGAGILVNGHQIMYSMRFGNEQKDSGYLSCPLLSSPVWESYMTTLIQEIFLVAQNSDDLQMQQNAAWAVSFLRNFLWSKESLNVENSVDNDAAKSKITHHSFSEDNSVVKLSEWLSNVSYSGTGIIPQVSTVITVLRCLLRAPRLPTVDWGLIVRRSMRYEGQVSELSQLDSSLKNGTLREQCLQFSIAHANQFDALLHFLDELSDLSRFRTLELNMQSCLLLHLAGLMKVFSGSRLDKLFNDIGHFFSSDSSYLLYNPDQKRMLRISCWSGLHHCLDEASLDSSNSILDVEKCMEVLFSLLPSWESCRTMGLNVVNPTQEWYNAVECLAQAPQDWLREFLHVPLVELAQGHDQFNEFLKKIVAKAKLVRIRCLPLTELGMLKAYILDTKCNDIWNVLVEVVAALQCAEGSVKQQWLVDTVEISCVSRYPSTAIQFLGLLAGGCCKYMPVLTLDQSTVLSDLPVTLPSLLSESGWQIVAESVVSSFWTSTERIYHWVARLEIHDDTPSTLSIDESENDKGAFLLRVMHHACISLKDYLPLEKQLRLANTVVS